MNDTGIIKNIDYRSIGGTAVAVALMVSQFLFSVHYWDGSHEDHPDVACEYRLVHSKTGAADVPTEAVLAEPVSGLYKFRRFEHATPAVKATRKAFASRAPPAITHS